MCSRVVHVCCMDYGLEANLKGEKNMREKREKREREECERKEREKNVREKRGTIMREKNKRDENNIR